MKNNLEFMLNAAIYIACLLVILGIIGMTMEGMGMTIFIGILVPIYVAATVFSIIKQRRGF